MDEKEENDRWGGAYRETKRVAFCDLLQQK